VLGLVGLAGAGQSELGRTVAGVLPLYGGSMRLRGCSYEPRSTASAVDRGIGFVTSNRADEGLAMSLTVAENLFPNLRAHGRRGWSLRRNRAEERQAQDLVQRFGIRPVDPTLAVEGLSGGNQQKVIIGRWLSTDVEILVLEDPTAGVDVGAKNEIYQLLDDALDRGVAVLLISSDVQEVAAVSHRALVFRDGLIAQEVDRAELSIAGLVAVASGAAA
jgi:ribose transport system ATP-binding protein